jgi:hypothetical protein
MQLSSSGDAYFPVNSDQIEKMKKANLDIHEIDSPIEKKLSAPNSPKRQISDFNNSSGNNFIIPDGGEEAKDVDNKRATNYLSQNPELELENSEKIGDQDILEENNLFIFGIELSLCFNEVVKDPENAEEIFYKNLVHKSHYFEDPWKFLNDTNLLIKYQEKVYNYKTAVPLIMSLLAFGEHLPENLIKKLAEEKSIFGFKSSKSQLDTISIRRGISDLRLKKEHIQRKSGAKYSFKPNNEQLMQLNLQPGANNISFVCSSRLSGKQIITASIYLWDYTDKIVISDIDGTITRSDFLGHVLPMVGKDWSHKGVAELYTKINANGYRMLYLTARALCQSGMTKNYVVNLFQGI